MVNDLFMLKFNFIFCNALFKPQLSWSLTPGKRNNLSWFLNNRNQILKHWHNASVNSKPQHPPGRPPWFCTLMLPRGRHWSLMTFPGAGFLNIHKITFSREKKYIYFHSTGIWITAPSASQLSYAAITYNICICKLYNLWKTWGNPG